MYRRRVFGLLRRTRGLVLVFAQSGERVLNADIRVGRTPRDYRRRIGERERRDAPGTNGHRVGSRIAVWVLYARVCHVHVRAAIKLEK